MKAKAILPWLITIIAVLTAAIVFVVRKPDQVIIERTIIDSLAVKTLRTKIEEMSNTLNARPKVIVVDHVVNDTIIVRDTIQIYPVGSFAKRRDYDFDFVAQNDSVKFKVNTDLYGYVYRGVVNDKMYYEDSLRVWITDMDYRRYVEKPQEAKAKGNMYIMAGLGVRGKQYVGDNETYKGLDISPHITAGYEKGGIGGYIGFDSNGIVGGCMINPIEIYRKRK